jgi:glycosyltransferase involved in cell wall biosynthesis
MRVLLTATSFPADAQDWRGRFIADMVTALADKADVDLNVWAPPGALPSNVRYAATPDEAAWLAKLASRGGIAQVLRRHKLLATGTAFGLIVRLRDAYRRSDADVLHVNWLQNALPIGACNPPALVTVLGSDFALLKMPGMVAMLRRAFKNRPVILAPNAEWMSVKLAEYFGDVAEIRPIPFGIAPGWFDIVRTVPAAPPFDWLAVTRLTAGKLGPLFEWGADFFGNEHVLHLFGPRQDDSISIPGWVRYHGPTYPKVLANEWFPRAAGLITLSRHDEGRPQVVLEAMTAGLPVVASRLPAHSDLVRHNETGMLVESPEDFHAALNFLAHPANNEKIGRAARAWVTEHIGTWSDCGERYLAAYRDLLERQP